VSNIAITILGISFAFLMNALGGAVVFLFKKDISGKINSLCLGFASGLMIASAIWSLLLPAIEDSAYLGSWKFLPAGVGMILGTIFLSLMDKLIPHLIYRNEKSNRKTLSPSNKILLAVGLHNIPEGLALGLVFGNAFVIGESSAFYSALWLAIGLGLQNFPEGSAVSLPIKEEYKYKKSAFLSCLLSGTVEPIMSVVGIFISSFLSSIMPWLLSFSAGAMLFVVAEELIPEAKMSHPSNIGAWGLIIGFVVMMVLDIII
jgi:ZIP family zinc transporter